MRNPALFQIFSLLSLGMASSTVSAFPLQYQLNYQSGGKNGLSTMNLKVQYLEPLSPQAYLDTLQHADSMKDILIPHDGVKFIDHSVKVLEDGKFTTTTRHSFEVGFGASMQSETVTTCRSSLDSSTFRMGCQSKVNGIVRTVEAASANHICQLENGYLKTCESTFTLKAVGSMFRSKATLERDLLTTNIETDLLLRLLAQTRSGVRSKAYYLSGLRRGVERTWNAITRQKGQSFTTPVEQAP